MIGSKKELEYALTCLVTRLEKKGYVVSTITPALCKNVYIEKHEDMWYGSIVIPHNLWFQHYRIQYIYIEDNIIGLLHDKLEQELRMKR